MAYLEVLQPLIAGVLLYGVAWTVWRLCLSSTRPHELRAEKRAKLLLSEFLTDEEHRELAGSGYLTVRSPRKANRIYRVRDEGRRVDVYDSGKLSMRMCAQPSQEVPAGDIILMHKFMIEGDEEEYLKTSNFRWQRSINGDGEPEWSHKPDGRDTEMLEKLVGGENVKGGCYWSIKDGEFISVSREGGKLEGGPDHTYVRIPVLLMLVVGPIMGLAFALFLPVSGLLVLVPFLAGKVRAAVSSGKVSAAHMAGMQVQPGMSYLGPSAKPASGEQNADPARAEGEEDDKLVELAKEIAEKRWQER